MQLALPQGSYVIDFTADASSNTLGTEATFGLFVDDVQVSSTIRQSSPATGHGTVAFTTVIDVDPDGANIDVRWLVNSGTANVSGRELVALRLAT